MASLDVLRICLVFSAKTLLQGRVRNSSCDIDVQDRVAVNSPSKLPHVPLNFYCDHGCMCEGVQNRHHCGCLARLMVVWYTEISRVQPTWLLLPNHRLTSHPRSAQHNHVVVSTRSLQRATQQQAGITSLRLLSWGAKYATHVGIGVLSTLPSARRQSLYRDPDLAGRCFCVHYLPIVFKAYVVVDDTFGFPVGMGTGAGARAFSRVL